MFQDRREIELAGKKYVLRQRSLQDILSIEKLYEKYATSNTGQALILAAVLRDAMKYDNYRISMPVLRKLFPITITWVMRNFSLAQMQECQRHILDLETYEVKKKVAVTEQVG